MDLTVDDINPHTKCIRLNGRLDHKGSGAIELRFTALTASNADAAAIDMACVDCIASIGMRLLLSCAKAKAGRGGRMVLFGLQPLVLEAMHSAGIDTLIGIHADQPSALAALST